MKHSSCYRISVLQKNVSSRAFVVYMVDQVLPSLAALAAPDPDANIQLEVLKIFVEISEFAGEVEKAEERLGTVFTALLVSSVQGCKILSLFIS